MENPRRPIHVPHLRWFPAVDDPWLPPGTDDRWLLMIWGARARAVTRQRYGVPAEAPEVVLGDPLPWPGPWPPGRGAPPAAPACATVVDGLGPLLTAPPPALPLAAGLLLLGSALAAALGHRLLPAVGLHRHWPYDRTALPPYRHRPGGPLGGPLGRRLAARPPRRLLWWAVQTATAFGRLHRPPATGWLLLPLVLGLLYDGLFCGAWAAAWWPLGSGATPLLLWDGRFPTWSRPRAYVDHLDSLGAPDLWSGGRRPRVRRSRTRRLAFPFWPVRGRSGLAYPLPLLRLLSWLPFALVGVQLVALVVYLRELPLLRRWPPWADRSYDLHWEALHLRSFVRKVGLLSLVLVPAHAAALHWLL